MPTTLTNGIQLPDKGSVDWYNSMQSNYNLIDTHLGNTDTHVTAEDKANWNSKQGSLSQAQLDAIAQVSTNTSDIATLQSGKANASHTHSSSDITDIGDYATKQYVDNSISGLVDSAPNALDTLNELAAALNDDANFASTVTTALSAKANSADLATVATSGDYDDLSNKPSIPINTSDLNNDSGFVTLNDFDIPAKTSDLTNDSGFITSSDVPTGTSDLINDSNFVDTSNPAVASGITSAKVTSYDSHVADTDIHVTTADKTKWNNGVSQSYVFRYSSTALVASSTNSNTLLDNTDNLKVGDKVIDSNGVLFSITAIDTANSTFTVGSALIDLALDANVVHTSGNESITGIKDFGSQINIASYPSIRLYSKYDSINTTPTTVQQNEIRYTDKNNGIISYFAFQHRTDANEPFRTCWRQNRLDGSNYYYSVNFNNLGEFYPENNAIKLGTSTKRWAEVYATNYYYGANSVEFSTKFVTTDTNQTISGTKIFSDSPLIYNSDSSANISQINLKNQKAVKSSTTETGAQLIYFTDKNNQGLGQIEVRVVSNGSTSLNLTSFGLDSNNQNISTGVQILRSPTTANFAPNADNAVTCGRALAKWSDVVTYKVNGLEPSSLSLPSGNASDIIDISSYITALDGTSNSYTVPANGWISIAVDGTAIAIVSSSWSDSRLGASSGDVRMLYPVLKNETVGISVTGTTLDYARFIPCQGNI